MQCYGPEASARTAELLPVGSSVELELDVQEKDRYGLPVAKFSYTQCDNDKAQVKAATKVMEDILTAAGAGETITINRYAHLVGGARMSKTPDAGVVNADQRVWSIPNLYVADGSVLPTQGAANPALTIMALAARLADHLTVRSG